MSPSQAPEAGSVVIPAYNEAAVISRCLTALAGAPLRVVVVANGCDDDTAARARAFNVEVIELSNGSKTAALNAGDAACGSIFPRIYLDADVVLSAPDALQLLTTLSSTREPRVCAPTIRFDVSKSSFVVRLFYRFYQRMPYLNEGMIGSGCYAVNGSGRRRWQLFPDITADDLFVQGRFTAPERIVEKDASFEVFAPRTVRGLLRVRTRTYRGNREADDRELSGSMSETRRTSLHQAVIVCLRAPSMVLPMIAYYGINVLAAIRSRRTTAVWLSDRTSRA